MGEAMMKYINPFFENFIGSRQLFSWPVKVILILAMIFTSPAVFAKEKQALIIKNIFNEALSSDVAYENLRYLCKNFPGRLCASPQAAGAVEFTKQIMEKMALDRVYLQELMVKNWKWGEKERATITSSNYGSRSLSVCALGGSIGTGKAGLTGKLVEVKNFKELRKHGLKNISGKIVFFNQALDPRFINTFSAYGKASFQRTSGAVEAARLGAIGVVVRSLTLALDDYPHTGILRYDPETRKIPAVAVSTRGADLISTWLQKDPRLTFYFRTTCQWYPEVKSYNVIGEIKGSTFPDKIISVGGHLDCWFNSEGAHDDGGGCMQAIEVLRLFKKLGIKPRHTLRAVMFMDEEVGQRGGQAYAEVAFKNKENHIVAMESDRGVLVPRAIGIIPAGESFEEYLNFQKFFDPYDIKLFKSGGRGGVDIGPLKDWYPDITLITLIPDSQRYFDYHHSANDTFDKVNRREMQMGSAALAALVYLIDRMAKKKCQKTKKI
jgi:hypothetical protein